MEKIEFRDKENIEQKSKHIKNPYAFLGHINFEEMKYLVPWAQYDEENRVVEHITTNKNIETPLNEEQIYRQTIDNDIALKILLNELYDRQ